MKKIVLLCNMGLSTSALMKKMIDYSKTAGYDYEISAFPFMEAEDAAADADCILIGPQIGFQLDKVKSMFPQIPNAVIDMMDYGMLDGKKVVESAKALMGD